jgi:hypothetical protein
MMFLFWSVIECAIAADTVSWNQLCIWMYIYSMDPEFAKMTVGCGVIHKHTVCAKYTELLKYKQYEYFIYSIMSCQQTKKSVY